MIVFTLLAFTWYGGQHVPKVLKDNKQILLGVAVTLVLNMFMGVEGLGEDQEGADDPCAGVICNGNGYCEPDGLDAHICVCDIGYTGPDCKYTFLSKKVKGDGRMQHFERTQSERIPTSRR